MMLMLTLYMVAVALGMMGWWAVFRHPVTIEAEVEQQPNGRWKVLVMQIPEPSRWERWRKHPVAIASPKATLYVGGGTVWYQQKPWGGRCSVTREIWLSDLVEQYKAYGRI